MKICPTCQHEISGASAFGPHCGATLAPDQNTSHGFEYKSAVCLFGLPLIHISFKYGPDHKPVVAKGVIAIGQFAIGYVAIAQFGIGMFSFGQFVAGAFVVGQLAAGYGIMAQIGMYLHEGHGQFVRSLIQVVTF